MRRDHLIKGQMQKNPPLTVLCIAGFCDLIGELTPGSRPVMYLDDVDAIFQSERIN